MLCIRPESKQTNKDELEKINNVIQMKTQVNVWNWMGVSHIYVVLEKMLIETHKAQSSC